MSMFIWKIKIWFGVKNMCDRNKLAVIARKEAEKQYNGKSHKCAPNIQDIVLFDRVFNNTSHDHIGIVLENYDNHIITAEGNVENVSRILERKKNSHIRAYIRIPDNFLY